MKLLQNKKTREIGFLECSFEKTPEKITVVEYIDGKRGSRVWYYNSLTELNDEWEDYEEPETYYYISDLGNIESLTNDHGQNLPEEIWHKAIKHRKEIGNYFETREEAEKAVEKLKAWKRLKNKGFRFTHWKCTDTISFTFDNYCGDGQPMSASDDLDLLFGGEDE